MWANHEPTAHPRKDRCDSSFAALYCALERLSGRHSEPAQKRSKECGRDCRSSQNRANYGLPQPQVPSILRTSNKPETWKNNRVHSQPRDSRTNSSPSRQTHLKIRGQPSNLQNLGTIGQNCPSLHYGFRARRFRPRLLWRT